MCFRCVNSHPGTFVYNVKCSLVQRGEGMDWNVCMFVNVACSVFMLVRLCCCYVSDALNEKHEYPVTMSCSISSTDYDVKEQTP